MTDQRAPNASNQGSALGVARFPSPWPPTSPIVLWTQRENGNGVDLLALPDGSFVIDLFSAGQHQRQDTYQKVIFTDGVMGILSFVWDDNITRLAINATYLSSRTEAKDAVCVIKLAPLRAPRPQVQFTPSPGVRFSAREELFLNTIKDIQSKLDQPSHYNLLRAAGMLRQLFLDERPLIHQINRGYRIPLSFELIPLADDLPIRPETYWCDISPDFGPPKPTSVCNLDQFLKTCCLIHHQQEFTVHDVITCCANVFGGVHAGIPKTDRERNLSSLQEDIRVGGHSMIDSTLKGITLVALWGCVPLLTAMFQGVRKE